MLLSNPIGKVVSDKIRLIRDTSIMAQSTRGTMSLGIATFVERGLRLARNMILARILAPEDFGLMAIVLATSIFFEAFSDVGIRQSIIHNMRGTEAEYLNMAWWLQAVRGLGLYLVVFLISPWVGSFYGQPSLVISIRVAFLAVIFNGLISPRAHVLEKELRFGRWIVINLGSAFFATLITIALAFWIRNVWALIIGFTTQAISRCLLSFILCPYRPIFRIDRSSLGELLKYAQGMFGLPLLTIIALKMDIVVLGKLVTAEQLGMYSLTWALAHQPAEIFSQTISRVLLAAFAKKQNDKQIIHKAVLKTIRTTVIVGIPLFALVVIFAGPILSIVYGPRYAAVAIPFGILCGTTLIRVQGYIFATVYLAVGKPHLTRRFVTIVVILIIGLIYPGIALFGLSGAAAVLLISNIIALFIQIIWMREVIGLRFKEFALCWLALPWCVQ